MSGVWLSRTLLHPIMSEPADAGGKSGPVAVPALGSGQACPTAAIGFCPSSRSTAHSQFEL